MTGSRQHHQLPTGTTTDVHGLTVLPEHTCLDLLASQPIGRLGFSSGALPVIFPINFVLDDRTVLFSSEDGSKLRAARQRAVACLEADWSDPINHDGWSVLVTGRLAVADPTRVEQLAGSSLAHWALDGERSFVEMPIELVSGRRIRDF